MKTNFYKAISILLTLLMVFSVTMCAVSTASAATEVTYYVADEGSDSNSGTNKNEPFKTITKAINAAKASGLGEGDTVNLRLCGYAAVTWQNSPAYDFKLTITSDDPTLRSGVELVNGFKFMGDVSFDYVRMDGALTNIYYNNHNITIAHDCAFAINNHYLGSDNGTQATAPQTVVLGQSLVGKSVWVGDNGKAKTYKADVTLGINNATSTAKVMLGSANGVTTFEKNLNLNIMQSRTIDFEKAAGGIDLKGALQVVINSDTPVLNEEKSLLASINAPGGYYYITNATRVGDIIEFTETAGTYKVDTDRYAVKATDSEGKEHIAADGILVLPKSGEYVLTSVKEIENPVYYVSSTDGNSLNDGLSPEKPLCAINEAIHKAVEEGYWEGDTVTVKVLSSTVDWSNEFKINSTTEMVVDDYSYLLRVESNNKASLSTVNFIYRQVMTGDVEFEDIKLNLGSQSGSRLFYANNHNVTFGENVSMTVNTLAFGTFNGSGKFDGQSIDIKYPLNGSISLGNDGHHNGRSFAEDVFLTLDNPKIRTKMYITCYHGGVTTMQKNFNIQIKAAESAEIIKGATIQPDIVTRIAVKGAIQLIANDDVILTEESISVLKSCSDSGEVYYLSNASGIKDLLEFTETAGKYKLALDSERCVVYAVDEEGNVITSKDGYLVLPKSGDYIIDAKVTPVVKEYFVSSSGSDENDGLTAANPLLTVNGAIKKANAEGLTVIDTLFVKVVGTANVNWGEDYTCSAGTIRVESNDLNNLSTITTPANSISDKTLTGLVEFDNIKLQGIYSQYNPYRLLANGRSITYGENVKMVTDSVSIFPAHQHLTVDDKLTFTVKNAYKGNIYLTYGNNNGMTYKKDFTIIVDNANAAPKFKIRSAYDSASANKFEGNLNIGICDAASVTFEQKGTKANSHYDILGAVQVITPLDIAVDLTNLKTIGKDDTAPKGGVYHLINATGVSNVLSFTETAGKYAVDTDKFTVVATAEGKEPITALNGFLVLPSQGEYTLTLSHTHNFDDACDEKCNSCDFIRDNVHVYDNSCDGDCNICSDTRQVIHNYDNGCDKLCNVCYEYRETSHAFSNEVDRECDKCGAQRQVYGEVLFKENGRWYYYVNGYKSNATTLVKVKGKWFFVQDGEWISQTKLVKYEGKWFYIQGGKWNSTVTDLKKYNGKWFYIERGKWNNTINTLHKINGKWFLITKGKWEATTGIVKYKDKDFYVKGGKWNSSVNTLYKKGSKLYAIKSGKWYKGKAILSYGGKKYYCNKGYAQTSFSGKVTVNKKTYTIKKGIVK